MNCRMVLALATLSWILCIARSPAQQIDAVSREVSVSNDLTNPVIPKEGVSREISVFNDLTNPVVPKDAVSREASIYNNLSPPVIYSDAVSREVSANNAFGCPTALHGNLSGNLTDDGVVTIADVTPFVNVLIGITTDPYLQQAADMNCDGKNDGLDIQLFINAMLSP